MPQKSRGRPTNSPKNTRITVRLDNEASNILDEYCKQTNMDRAESIRQGIKKLKSETKK